MTLTRRFATVVVDHRRWVVGIWVVLAALLMPLASKVDQRLEVAATIKGSESAKVEQLLAERFTSGFAQYAVLVMTGAPDPRTTAGIEFLKGVREKLKVQPFVSGTFSYLDTPDTLFVGKAGTTLIVVGLKPGSERPDKLIPKLRANDSEAIAEGLARTGGLITSAAAIMIVVFAGFTLGDFVIVKILGFALAVAVLVDATVVRVAIGPALFKLAGRWNWWPGERLSRKSMEEGRAERDRQSYAA